MFFTYLANSNAPKNKLQIEASRLLQLRSNRLINDRKSFVSQLQSEIEFLNTAHSKCTPLRFKTVEFNGITHVYLGDHFTVGFCLYPVKEGGAA